MRAAQKRREPRRALSFGHDPKHMGTSLEIPPEVPGVRLKSIQSQSALKAFHTGESPRARLTVSDPTAFYLGVGRGTNHPMIRPTSAAGFSEARRLRGDL